MARPRALPNADIFALARQLVAEGEQPSITKIAEKAKAEFGVTPSYTTLKHVLHEWRQVEAANAPKALPAEFLDAMITALTPMYGRLVAQARAELEPQTEAAQRDRDEAEAERDRIESERARLVEEVTYLRRQVDDLTARDQLSAVVNADLAARTATLETELANARAQTDELTQTLHHARVALEHAEQSHRRDEDKLREHHAAELSQMHQTHAAAVRQWMDDTELLRRETAAVLKQRDEQISAMERERVQQRAVADELRTRLEVTQEAHAVAQATLQRQAIETASFVSAREQLIGELRSIREEFTAERRAAQNRIASLETQLSEMVNARSTIDERYAQLMSMLNDKRGAQ